MMLCMWLRRNEVLTLRRDNINLERRTLTVIRKCGNERVMLVLDNPIVVDERVDGFKLCMYSRK